jgi:hypothetical protein
MAPGQICHAFQLTRYNNQNVVAGTDRQIAGKVLI